MNALNDLAFSDNSPDFTDNAVRYNGCASVGCCKLLWLKVLGGPAIWGHASSPLLSPFFRMMPSPRYMELLA